MWIMAKIKQPLFSFSATGQIGGVISYRSTGGPHTAKFKPQPYPQQTVRMLANQQKMKDARAAFAALDGDTLARWRLTANQYSKDVWVYFFTQYQYQMIEAPGAPLIPETYIR
jgi:hypothetical protein